MTEKEVCLMCENYSEDTKCDQHDSCKLMAVLKENRALKKKVSQLKRQLDESELKRSYMVNPSAIGYRNDMGVVKEKKMGKLSRRDMEELREACSYDCGYTDTEEVVKDITAQVLEELDSDTTYGDEVGLVDSDRGEEFTTLDEFVRIFWDKAAEKILNVVESQGR